MEAEEGLEQGAVRPAGAPRSERRGRAKAPKNILLQEFEDARIEWQNERCRLHAEIEHLRETLDRMREQVAQTERVGGQLADVGRENDMLAVRLQEREAELRALEAQMRARIDELEQRVVNLLERSGEDRRKARAVEERMDAELEAANRSFEMEAERRLRVHETEWVQERRALQAEIEHLKKQIATRPTETPEAKASLIDRIRGRQ